MIVPKIDKIFDIILFFIKINKQPKPHNIKYRKLLNSDKKFYKKSGQKLGEGSSRVTYILNYFHARKVHKLAKNQRGIEHNKFEVERGKLEKTHYPRIIEYRDDYYSITLEYTLIPTYEYLETLLGTTLDNFHDCVIYNTFEYVGYKWWKKPKNFDKIKETEIFKQVEQIMIDEQIFVPPLVRDNSIVMGLYDNKIKFLAYAPPLSEIFPKKF
jgi:hypothetical protein